MSDDRLVFTLRNDLRLTIAGQPTLHALGNFLKAAIVHLKNQRDIQKSALYKAGSFQGHLGAGECAISHPGDSTGDYLSPAAWAQAVVDAYVKLNTLEELLENLPDDEETETDTTRRNVIAALKRGAPVDQLAALGVMLQETTASSDRPRPDRTPETTGS
jgi:hypothetical protein